MGFRAFISNLPSLLFGHKTSKDGASTRPALIVTLVLSHDNPYNTTIYLAEDPDTPLYSVITKRASDRGKRTYVYRGSVEGQLLAHLEWRGLETDIVHFGEEPPQSFDRWLKQSRMPFKECVRHIIVCGYYCNSELAIIALETLKVGNISGKITLEFERLR
jgi:hypothetical protein